MKITNKFGIIVDSLRLPLRESLTKAKELGADGVQISAVNGEMAPENLTASARRELRDYIGSIGLEISALCGDLGGHGFQDRRANPAKVEKSKRILDLAADLGTNIVTTHIGVVPDDRNSEVYAAMQQACEELAAYASGMNGYFAIETGPETAAHLKSFLDTLRSKGVAVNFDPANLVMVTGDDPVAGVRTLKDYIVHTHAKDGIRLRVNDPRLIYGSLENEPLDHANIAGDAESGDPFREVPLGEGAVDWDAYIQALQENGYAGYLTIEREVGDDPAADIAKALRFLGKYRR